MPDEDAEQLANQGLDQPPPAVDDPGMEPAALPEDQRPDPEPALVDSAEGSVITSPTPPGSPEDLPLGERAGWSPPETPPPGVHTAEGDEAEGLVPPPENTEPGPVGESEPIPQGEPIETECCFLVYLEKDGHWMADPQVGRPISMGRIANYNDFYHAAATITRDIQASDTASKTLLLQQDMARRMMEQQQTAAVAAQMGGPVGRGVADLSQFKTRR